jgi:hypothetical protein
VRTPITPPLQGALYTAACFATNSTFNGYDIGEGFDFVFPTDASTVAAPYDVSAFRGISFIAKATQPDGGAADLWVGFPDLNTFDGYPGSACNLADAGVCDDYWSTFVAIGSTYSSYSLDFASLSQIGFGYQSSSFDTQHVFGMRLWLFGPVAAGTTVCITALSFTL